MAVTQQDVVARWNSLATLSDAAAWTAALADADLEVSASAWGRRADLAQVHLVAHLLFASHPELAPSPLQSETVGSISRSYAVAGPLSQEGLHATAAGREYLRLRRQLGVGAMVV